MKTLALLILAASLALGQNKATVRVVVTNEAGTVTSDVTVNTTDEALAAINAHRQSFVETPEVKDEQGNVTAPAVLRYPTRGAWWRMVILGNIKSIAGEQTKAVLAAKKKADAAQAAVEVEKEKVAQ